MATGKREELLTRSISGLFFVALMVYITCCGSSGVSFYISRIAFAVFLFGSLFELFKLKGDISSRSVILTASAFTLLFLLWCMIVKGSMVESDRFLVLLLLFLLLLLFIIFLYIKNALSLTNANTKAKISSLYVVPAFFLVPIYLETDGKFLLSIFILIWAGDVGAYCFGSLFGQGERGHRLAPQISPKKSWEGVYGGAFMVVIGVFVLHYLGWFLPRNIMKEMSFIHHLLSLLLGLVIYISSILGDLVESVLKRKAGVKDSGKFLPGHGGFLDRFDSFSIALPVFTIAYIFVRLLCLLCDNFLF